jgi:hypothetical protein
MKKIENNYVIIALLILLITSITFNIIQGDCIEELNLSIRELKMEQSYIENHINNIPDSLEGGAYVEE